MFIVLLTVSLHQASCRAIHTQASSDFVCTTVCALEQNPQENLTVTCHIVLCNGTINAIREIFWFSPAELGTKPGSKPQPVRSWVKWSDHQTVQMVNSPCSAAARQEPSSVMCALLLQISTWTTISKDRHHIACNWHAWSCANRHQLRIWLMYSLHWIYWQLGLRT